MENVGIRELKDNLSKYLMRVKGGRTLSITERSRHIADIVPAKPALPAGISELLSTASASWPEAGRKPRGCKNPPVVRGERTLASMIAEDRR